MATATINTTQFARIVKTSTRHVRRLTQEGVLQRARSAQGDELRGRYSLAAVGQFCDHLRAQLKVGNTSHAQWEASRNRRAAAEAALAEIELARLRGETLDSRDVEFVLTQMLTACRSRLLAIPSRSARLCVGKTDFRQIHDLLAAEIEQALHELAGFNRSMFRRQEQQYLERRAWEDGAALNGE